jgi:hypothetical protein
MSLSHAPSARDRAAQLLRGCFISEDSVSRRNVLHEVGGTGHANLRARREWAVAWQLLERAGYICPEPGYPAEGDAWFITPTGTQARNGPTEDYLARDLPS